MTDCKNPTQLANTNFVPIRSAPENRDDVTTIIILKNSAESQGIGKPFCHEEFGKKATKNENFAEKMRLISTILITSKPLIVILKNYQTGITLEYDLIWYSEATTNDLFHAISVITKNQQDYFNNPDTIIIGAKNKENKLEVTKKE